MGTANVQSGGLAANTHRPLRRTVSSPARRKYEVRGTLFGDVNHASSPNSSSQGGAYSTAVTKRTSSPIEIPDSPSSLSVITISSSSDEMEPNSAETNKMEHSLHSVEDNDGQEQCEVSEHEDNCDGFGDDEDEDDCIVTSSFSVGSVSPECNNDDYISREMTTDDAVTSTTNGTGNFDAEIPVGTFGECLTLNEDYSNESQIHRFQRTDPRDAKTLYCSDTESAEEKESAEISSGLETISETSVFTSSGLLSSQTRLPSAVHEPAIPYLNGQPMLTGEHVGRHGVRRQDPEGPHQSPTRVNRPSSLGVFPYYPQHPAIAGPTYASPTLPYRPSQPVLITGNESRCCISETYQEPVLLLPTTHAQLVPQPIYTGMARIPTAPVPAQLPYTYVTSSASSGSPFVNPGFPQRQVLSRGGYQGAVRPGLSLPESGYQGASPFVSQRYQVPVVGAVKAVNVVPSGACNNYGQYLLNSSPNKARVYYS